MNPEVQRTFDLYRNTTTDDVVAALLTLADVFSHKPADPIFIEPADCESYSVKEAAVRLRIDSQVVYHEILAGRLKCHRLGETIRIPISEIVRYEAARGAHE